MKIREFLRVIDSFAPFDLAEDWDNSGLMLGSLESEVKGVAVCLDAVHEAVIKAAESNCNVLLCHHPLIFRGIRSINLDSEQGMTISEAIKRDVNIIAAHTNWDKASEGVNFQLAKTLGLNDIMPLDSFGLSGKLTHSMSPNEFLEHVKRVWNLSRLDYYAANHENISRVSLCGGSGSEFWRSAKKLGSDVYITADMKYHDLIDSTRDGLNILLIEHGEMERVSLPALANKVSDCGIKVILLDVKALTMPYRMNIGENL